MKKLVIFVPCYNEEKTLPITLEALPKKVEGFESVEVLVVNDGSIDKTLDVAKNFGVKHIIDLKSNYGLAYVFVTAISFCNKINADCMVVFDADNQYSALDIQTVVNPIVKSECDIVVGERPIEEIKHFSFLKKILQRIGSALVRYLSGSSVKDAPSGFRAFNKMALRKLHLFSSYSHTMETLVAARSLRLKVKGVPIRVNSQVLRKSRLMKSMTSYIRNSLATLFRFYLLYNPYKIFLTIFFVSGFFSFLLFFRFIYFYLIGNGNGWIQSLVVTCALVCISCISFAIATLSDMIGVTRNLIINNFAEIREYIYDSKS